MNQKKHKIGKYIIIVIVSVVVCIAVILCGYFICKGDRFHKEDADSADTESGQAQLDDNDHTIYAFRKASNDNDDIRYFLLEYAYINADTVNFRISVCKQTEGLQEGTAFTSNTVEQNGDTLHFRFAAERESYDISCHGNQAIVKAVMDGEEDANLSGEYIRSDFDTEEKVLPEVSPLPAYVADQYTEGFEMDAVLANGIRSYLGLDKDAKLTKDLLRNMRDLYIWEDKLVTLKGIRYLENLEILMVGETYLSDITELTALTKLKQFSIGSGYITEIPDFSQHSALTEMHITSNLISDLKPVLLIPNLKLLNLADNRITSISGLENVQNIEMLDLSNNVITDYHTLQNNVKLQNALPMDYNIYLQVEQEAKKIVSSIVHDEMSDIEKEAAVHQYLVNKMNYSEKTRPQRPLGYYGIIENEGVCGDYADAMSLLSAFAGLDVITVSSDTHAWNMIKLWGSYYNVDVLWDDSQSDWTYFNRSTAYLFELSDHNYDLHRYPIAESDMNPLLYIHIIR